MLHGRRGSGRCWQTLTFREFAKVGVPLTLLNVAVCFVFLAL